MVNLIFQSLSGERNENTNNKEKSNMKGTNSIDFEHLNADQCCDHCGEAIEAVIEQLSQHIDITRIIQPLSTLDTIESIKYEL